MLGSLWRHRAYIWRAATGDFRHRYAGSAAGVLWNLLRPAAMIAIFALVFTRIVSRGGFDVPGGYVVYLCAALLPWNHFAEALNQGARAFLDNSIYLRKLPIEEEVFVAHTVLSATLGLSVTMLIFAPVALAFGAVPSWHWMLVPLPMAALMLLALGLSLALATLNAYIRDTAMIVQLVLQVAFWTYPIVYDEGFLPERFRALLPWNPLYPALTATRDLLLHHRVPEAGLWLAMAAWPAAACVFGFAVLHRLRRELRDVI